MSDLPKIPLYHVDHLIAEGGTAKVYWGIDLRSGFPVAIKELKIKHFKNPVIKDKFKSVETQLYLYLQHPNIPKLVDFIDMKEREQLYIVMEFVEGESLEHYIYSEIGLIPEEQALPMFLEILDTVEYIHDNGILHLDIKSNNVMIQPDGRVKLIDLGIASRMGDASSSTGYGTPAYMPPEQTEKGACGRYTDIFALGILLFEMLTGSLPFISMNPNPGKARDEIRYKIKNEPTPVMSSFYPPINRELQHIVEGALAKEPAKRYQSCREFRNRIDNYLSKRKYGSRR
ncbi:MAG: serine/threonine protein kinase [Clostridium sp.]|nr:serine/threonine protein kinase [Bacteroides sp.]MCM1198485.1 serine/threonine protein kinase [Clostridium sp.]